MVVVVFHGYDGKVDVYEIADIEVQNATQRIGEYMMIESLVAENFRCFRTIGLSAFRRVNIVVGDNGSGKTALLELIKLSLDGAPNDFPWMQNNRNIPTIMPPNPTPEQFQAIFLDFFHLLDSKKTIVVGATDSQKRKASLQINFDPSRAITAQPQQIGFQAAPAPPPITIVPLVFNRVDFQGQKSAPAATINAQGQLFLEPAKPMGIVSGLISSAFVGAPGENAQWLSKLSIEKRNTEAVEALKRHFPFIGDVTSETIMGFPMLYCDLPYLPRKVPMSLVSSGITRLFTIILAIIEFRGGVVLLDEVENGISHNQYGRLWRTLADLAKTYNTQLFVSTHSAECLREATPVIEEDPNDFTLLRVRREKAESNVQFFRGDQLEAALEKNGEVRD